jgi:hypothetical protein
MSVYREISLQKRQAIDFLRNFLSDGERHPVSQIHFKAETNRISRESLQFAKRFLNVEVSSESYFKFWQLPNGK